MNIPKLSPSFSRKKYGNAIIFSKKDGIGRYTLKFRSKNLYGKLTARSRKQLVQLQKQSASGHNSDIIKKRRCAGAFFVLTNRSFIGIIFEQLRECWNGRQARLRCVWFRRVGSSPISRTNKKVPFVYRTKGTFLSDVCLRQMMLATPMMPLTLMMSLC